jgi:peptide deformylase
MAKILPIIINPNPILRKKSAEVKTAEILSPKFKRLILDMEKTMTEKDGAGLAAPQIGHNLRLLVMNANRYGIIIMINPKITKKSWAKEIDEEGCLSVLDSEGRILYAPIARHKKINCLYVDALGQKQKIIAEGLLARIVQHEVDHLDGILFIDHLTDKKLLRTLSDEEKDARRQKIKAE